MKNGTGWMVIGVPAIVWLGACQSLQQDDHALRVVPAGEVRHGTSPQNALYAIGRYHQGQVRYDKAIETYRRLLAEYPEHAEARNALAIVLATQGRYGEAADELEKAAESAPDSASIRNNLGYAYLLLGRVAEAVAVLQIAARLDPANRRVRDNLEAARTRGGDDNPMMRPAATAGSDEQAAPGAVDAMQLVAVAANVFALRLPAGRTEPRAERLADAAPPPGTATRLEVSNGNGTTGLAKKTSGHLAGSGYARIRLTNEPPYRLAATEIQYRPGFEPQARGLRAALRADIPLVASQRLRSDVQLRLALGKDVKSVRELVAGAPAAQLASADAFKRGF